jgi:uncharacterized protein
MSQPAKLQEPTMEEILASIRRIIAEDDLRPPAPPPPSAKPVPADSAPILSGPIPAAPVPAAGEPAPRDEIADGFDDPQVSNVAANDVFEQRESSWRPGEFAGVDGAAEETREPAAADIHRDAPRPPLDFVGFAAAPPEPSPPEPPKAPREPSRPPLFEALRAEAELVKLELARSEFARARAAKSDFARPVNTTPEIARADHARRDLSKPDLPKFDMPRRDAARWESVRPESQEPMRSEPMRPPAPPPVLRAADDEGLLSARTTAAVDLAFNTLAQTVLVQNARSLEDLVREMLKPMLKAWLDDNLPGLVERLVRAEIERVSRGRS